MFKFSGLLIPALVAAATVALLWLLQHLIQRIQPRRAREFRLPSFIAAAGYLSGALAGLVLAGGLLGHMSPSRDDFGAWVGLLLASSALSLCMIIAAANWRMWQTEIGVQIRSAFGVVKPFTPWNRIAKVRADRQASVMVFDLRDGGALKVPFYTPGLPEAIRAAQAHGATLDEGLVAQFGQP